MPFVSVRRDVIAKIRELRSEAFKTTNGTTPHDGYALGKEHGFMEAVRMFMPSESVGLMIMMAEDDSDEGWPTLEIVDPEARKASEKP